AAHLRDYMATHGGRASIRVSRGPLELDTGRSGVITSFSSAGPTAFGHDLRPDISAPGGPILSSTLPRVDPSGFAVFDGTSTPTPRAGCSSASPTPATARERGRCASRRSRRHPGPRSTYRES